MRVILEDPRDAIAAAELDAHARQQGQLCRSCQSGGSGDGGRRSGKYCHVGGLIRGGLSAPACPLFTQPPNSSGKLG